MRLVAIKSFTYAGSRVNAGDVFKVKTDRDAKLLVGIKSARHVEGREDAKISPPDKKLVERASVKIEPVTPEVKEESKLPEVEEIKPEPEGKEEPAVEEKSEEEAATEEEVKEEASAAEEVKPVATNQNSNKRTYNKRK